MSEFRNVTVARAQVAQVNQRGGFRQITTERVQPENASGSRETFQRGREDGSLIMIRDGRSHTARLQLSVVRPSTAAEHCPLGLSGAHSDWIGIPFAVGVAAVFEGDSNHDGRRDYLVLLSNGAAVLLERSAGRNTCGIFGPPP